MKVIRFYHIFFTIIWAFFLGFTHISYAQKATNEFQSDTLSYYYIRLAMDNVDSSGSQAEVYARKAIEISKSHNDLKSLGDAYNALALWYQANSQLSKALAYYDTVVFYASAANDNFRLNTAYNNIGVIYRQQQSLEPAIQYFEKSLYYAYACRDTLSIVYCLSNIGNAYAVLGQYEKALSRYIKAYNLLKELPETTEELAYINNNIAGIYRRLKKFDFAVSQYNLAYAGFSNCENINAMLSVSIALAQTYLDWAKPAESFQSIEMGANLCDKASDKALKESFYNQAYKTCLANNNISEALKYLELYASARETNYDAELKQMLVETGQKYELDKITRKKKEQERSLRQQRIIIISLALVVLLSLLIALLFAMIFIQKNRLNKKLKQKNTIIESQNLQITESISYAKQILALQNVEDVFPKEYCSKAFVWYQPKEVVGGDFYRIAEKDDCLTIAVGDCTGHGAAGGFLAASYLRLFDRAMHEASGGPATLFTHLNRLQSEFFGSERDVNIKHLRSCAMSIIMIEKNNGVIHLVSASQKVIVVSEEGTRIFSGDKLMLGNDDFFVATEHRFSLQAGDKIYLFTDGITDQLNRNKTRKITANGLSGILTQENHKDLNDIELLLKSHWLLWKGEASQTDDILVLGIAF
ncbi:MAG: tetratricopeptide repeat protein [Bacteroidales bacterium]|nr:tetratricopeptide repeat protein [Bacteroidales bacterium]HOY38343.1 tetratricopeptide repeat protein [Bacteroidales bacterium]HQP03438.1 tetratricopeptide repeat protein [Bacteroidales bacterium]